jgi:hypothetical protein
MEVNAALERVRAICLALPEATEKIAWGEPTWRAGKIFVMFSNHHHGDPHVAIWCNAAEGVQEALVRADPKHFFRPPYVGPGGWVGVRLDTGLDWSVVASVIKDAYRVTAPARLVRQLDEGARKRFQATLIDGHKGLAFELPFDPGRKDVSGTLNGVPFDSVVVRRAKKLWVLVEKELAEGAKAGDGDTIDVVLWSAAATPRPAAPSRSAPDRGRPAARPRRRSGPSGSSPGNASRSR